MVSDHLPVSFQLAGHASQAPSRRNIPHWLIKKVEFVDSFIAQHSLHEPDLDKMTSSEAVGTIKHIAHEAAREAKIKLQKVGASSLEEQAYWLCKWIRANRVSSQEIMDECIRAFPSIEQHGGNTAKVHAMLKEVMNEMLTKELESILNDDSLSHKEKVKKHETVDKRLSLWRQSCKTISLSCVFGG